MSDDLDDLTPPDTDAVRLFDASTRFMHALAHDDADTMIELVWHLAGDDLLFRSVTTWALMVGEFAPTRVAGGELLRDDAGAPLLAIAPLPADAPPWKRAVEMTARAALHRDGALLYDTVESTLSAGVDDPAGADTQGLVGYIASVADSARHTVEATTRPEAWDRVALVHMLGAYADTAARWSVAGVAYRLGAATLTVVDLGVDAAGHVVDPEVEALARLSGPEVVALITLAGRAYGDLLGGDPRKPIRAEDIEVGAHDGSGIGADPYPWYDRSFDDRRPHAHRAAAYAMRVAVAYRGSGGDPQPVLDVLREIGGPGYLMTAYGLCNFLAIRCGQLWPADRSSVDTGE